MDAPTNPDALERGESYGESEKLSVFDRFGVWLSSRAVRKNAKLEGARVADLGCGFDANFSRTLVPKARAITVVDVALADDLKELPNVTAIEGYLEHAMPNIADASQDVVLLLSVVEHISDPQPVLDEANRILAPGGKLLVNVPSWRGKKYLELLIFKLKLSPAAVEGIEDHKAYYDPRDLWPLLIRAGFTPSKVKVHKHKFGLNTFAACEKS